MLKNLAIEIKKVVSKHIDKVAHMTLTYAIAYTISHQWKVAAGVSIAVLVGVGKEYLDKALGHKFSIGDLVADGLGIVLAYAIFTLV